MASDFLDVLEKDEKARKRISKLVVGEILLDPELKLLLVEKSIQTLATKDDLRETEERLKEDLKSYVDVKFEDMNKRIDDLHRRIDDLHKITLTTLVAIVVSIVGMVLSRMLP